MSKRAAVAVVVLSPFALAGAAWAHITLQSPADWLIGAGGLGTAQKHEPCGDPSLAKPSGQVTTFHPGDMIPVAWTEVIPHTGWFRLALTPDRALLREPMATVDPATGDAKDATTTKPEQTLVTVDGVYVMDGLFRHDGAEVGKTYSWMFPVPAITCAHCTLQLIQFMVDHGSNTGGNDGYFYHLCADIAITPAAGGSDGGAAPVADGGAVTAPAAPQSSGCSLGPAPVAPGLMVAVLVPWLALLRRRRR